MQYNQKSIISESDKHAFKAIQHVDDNGKPFDVQLQLEYIDKEKPWNNKVWVGNEEILELYELPLDFLMEEYENIPPQAAVDLQGFVQQLINKGLVKID